MTNANDCAYPADNQTQTEGGLTKREYFAAMAKHEEISLNYAKELMNSEPPKDIISNIKWWLDAEAAYYVMKADALINALNK